MNSPCELVPHQNMFPYFNAGNPSEGELKYLKIEYQSNPLGEKDGNKYFSADESLINHYKGRQIWLLGICDNITKNFRIETSYNFL